MGRKRRRAPSRSSSVERSPQSIEPGTWTAPATRSRSRVARSGTSTPSDMAPTVPQEVQSSGSRTTRASVAGGKELVTPAPASASTAGGKEMPTPAPASASTAGGEECPWPASASRAGGEEVDPEDTAAGAFLPNSPIRVPYLLEYDSNGELCDDDPSDDTASVLMEPFWKAEQEYNDRIAQIRKLPTLDKDAAGTPNIIQESAADTILKASEFVLGLSSFIDGELHRECTGILMEWSKGSGTILTTPQLICSRSPNMDQWLGGDEYALNAEVRVQLLRSDDFGKGELMYLDKQYGFALFRVLMDEPKRLPRFSNERFAQDVFLLGRYELNLRIGNGKVLSKGAGAYSHHHYMYTDADITSFAAGGAVINFEGDVTGMISSRIQFIPSSTIQKCLEIWRTHKHVPRIHLGMKLFGIKCLNLVSKEKIYRKYNVDSGLIVVEVSGKSSAEQLGVRMGDIILSVNGERIATAVELENKLLDMSKAHLEKGIVVGSGVDVTLALVVFNTTKCARGRIQLRAKLSNDEEIIEEGKTKYEVYRRSNIAAQ